MLLEFEVIPETALRNEQCEFLLGMPIGLAIACIQRVNRHIRGVELLYSNESPTSNDIIVVLTQQGIRLVFDAKNQRLKIIEVFDFSNVALRYCSSRFSVPSEPTTVTKIEQCFGATHPGVYDSKQQVYVLSWRGLSFMFPTASKIQPGYAHGLGSLQLSDGPPPVISKMCIYAGSTAPSDAPAPAIPLPCYIGGVHLQQLSVLTDTSNAVRGVDVQFTAEGEKTRSVADSGGGAPVKFERKILFGDHERAVQSALGAPDRLYYKSEDKMRIHRPSGVRRFSESRFTDYFYNYFTLGLDILFSGETQCVKKFVLHTNFPGHYDFAIYNRCLFELCLPEAGNANKNITITPFTKWCDMWPALAGDDQRQCQPVVLNRVTNTTTDNPFGATFCYGFGQLIFEVMANDHLAAVTLFEKEKQPAAA